LVEEPLQQVVICGHPGSLLVEVKEAGGALYTTSLDVPLNEEAIYIAILQV
jgi:hypothetical protein